MDTTTTTTEIDWADVSAKFNQLKTLSEELGEILSDSPACMNDHMDNFAEYFAFALVTVTANEDQVSAEGGVKVYMGFQDRVLAAIALLKPVLEESISAEIMQVRENLDLLTIEAAMMDKQFVDRRYRKK
jgi:hypothetical protein